MAAKEKNSILDSESLCLLLGADSALLARGEIESPPDAPNIQVRITGGDTNAVVAAEIVQIMPVNHQLPGRMARVIFRRSGVVTFEPMRQLGESVRQNFRMQVDFESFVYPKGGGRAAVRALDLSCGGIAMYSAGSLETGQVYEVVIPITEEPLLLDCEILRRTPYGGGIFLYAAKFVDLIHDQEAMLREAVFQAQIDALQAKKNQKQKTRK